MSDSAASGDARERTAGRHSEAARERAIGADRPIGSDAAADSDETPAAPWHFKVLLLGTVGYLIYRLIWFIFWLTGHAWHG